MKHTVQITKRPKFAETTLKDIMTAMGQVLQAVGTLLTTKEQNSGDPYDWTWE